MSISNNGAYFEGSYTRPAPIRLGLTLTEGVAAAGARASQLRMDMYHTCTVYRREVNGQIIK